MTYWEPGSTINWIYHGHGRKHGVKYVRPMTVVRDDAHGLAAWLAPGTPILRPVLPDGREIRDWDSDPAFGSQRVAKLDVWRDTGILKYAPTGVPWSIWHFWDADGAFANWYVNVEHPHERSGNTLTTEDAVLDLIVTPDHRITRKDTDELATARKIGTYDDDAVARIEAWAEEAEAEIARWRAPFDGEWLAWRPDPSWRLPVAPTGYEVSYIADELVS